MQETNMVRNIAIIGHGNCGKTSLAEAMLFTAGKINRLGKVDDGNATMDYEEEEIARKISINTSFHNYSWKKHSVFLIDTPGDDNFLNETVFASHVCDSALFTIGAVLGVKGQTVKFSNIIKERKLPTLIAINKMDRERADFHKTVDEIKESLAFNPVIVQLPIGAEDNFKGYVDIISGKAYLFDGEKGGVQSVDVPAELASEVASLREALMENVAETDDDLIEKFLEEGELTEEELLAGLKKGIAAAALAPICVCAATLNKGTAPLLDIINDLMPCPSDRPPILAKKEGRDEMVEIQPTADAPFSALVFKTMADPYAGRLTILRIFSGVLQGDTFYNSTKKTSERFGQLYVLEGKEQKPVESGGPGMIIALAKLKETATGDTLCDAANPVVLDAPEPLQPVISFAVSAKKGEEEKVFSSITRMLDEDLTLRLTRQPQTKQVLLSGVGRVHLDVVGAKIKRKFGVQMELSTPKIPYMETIRSSARVQGKHKKQSGGRGQFGDCWIEISPLPGGGYEFEDKIVGGVIPQQYRPAVDKGIQEAMEKGVLAGYPVIDVKIALVDGSFHNVDSSEMAFKIAGSLAFKKGAQEAGLILLEPYMNMEIKVGKDSVGDVMGDLNSRRGKVMGMDSADGLEVINAQVPQSEILSYATDLTSMTGGLGSFNISFSHYEEVPAQIAEKIVAEANKENN
ncbi:elongation factor G [Desulfopila sp. IMCC35006]|uniref:elongation factor G n=1 Tax=Desulfopila sp. IMCC35006 TaxID=2569542 RepID=UPI0010AC19E4|nr:elongation factor G [Desulfopila sp. IMCC35006]TKB27668.1 elongation factor G [Desulfopila sp. IMCC35006]